VIANRHNGGIIVGFCDGHAKLYPEGFKANDPKNAVYQLFFKAKELGYLKP